MTKYWKKGLTLFLALFMVFGMLPLTVFASVDRWTGMPLDVKDDLVLSIYTPEGKFPGEPAVYGTEKYKNFNHRFAVESGAVFKSSAADELNWDKIKADIVKGTPNGGTQVWGVYDAAGTKDYFLEDASIIQPENEAKIIRAIKTDVADQSDEEVLKKYEVIWYVIKLQHSSGRYGVTEWHIDGVVKERAKISINYYGNGNTSGNAPLGVTDHIPGDPYTILDKNNMKKEVQVGGKTVSVDFLGWSAKADGTGAEIGFYQPGVVINPTENISLYAMWDTLTVYTATVNTYLDGVLTDDSDIHGTARELYLSKDGVEYIKLDRSEEGVYSTKIIGNGKFLLYNKNADGTYTQVSDQQLVIYNSDSSMDVHHYYVDTIAAPTEGGETYGDGIYTAGTNVTVTAENNPGYKFVGWYDEDNALLTENDEYSYSFTINANRTLTAKFEVIEYTVATIADPVNGGTTTGDGNYNAGEDVTVTADNKTGYKFVGWYDEDDALLTEAEEYSFTINADRTLTAKFEVIEYTVATIADPVNGGTTTGDGTYAAGTSVTVTAVASDGYRFDGWYENGVKVSVAEEYAFEVTGDHTLTAKFYLKPITTYTNDYAYIFGYNDFTMAAEGPLLRCEAAVMVHRLAKQNNQRGTFDYATVKAKPTFADVKPNEWFFSGMEYIAYRGGFKAQMGGMVQPYVQITRGEVFKIIALGLGFTEDTTLSHEGYGELLKEFGYVLGTGNGLETGKLMTRAEFCAMFNRIIGRENALLVDSEGNQITADTYGFKDLANEESKWYYDIMLRATSAYEGEYVSTAKRAKRNPLDDYS